MHDDLLGVVNHESGHAVAAYFKEFTFDQISVESPASYRGELDRVKFPPIDVRFEPPSSDHQKLMEYVDALSFIRDTGFDTILRMGAMAASEEWTGHGPSSDRAKVLQLCPVWLPPDGWELLVESLAETLFKDPRFGPAHTALARELLENRSLSWDRAEGVIREAIRDLKGPI